jgi:hypothetical protein
MTDNSKCYATVSHAGDSWLHPPHCKHKPVAVENGHPYCKVHLPSVVKARRDKAAKEWDAKWNAETGVRAREANLAAAREAVVKAAMERHRAPDCAAVQDADDALRDACAALAKLEGK